MEPKHKSNKKAYYGTSTLSRLLDNITKPALKQRGFAEARIITDWAKIVGEVIARYSLPQKLIFPPNSKEQGVLTIDVYDSAFATEIHYLGPLILEKIATYFGYQAVARLNIVQKPMVIEQEEIRQNKAEGKDVPPEVEASVNDIADEDVKAALMALGKQIYYQSE